MSRPSKPENSKATTSDTNRTECDSVHDTQGVSEDEKPTEFGGQKGPEPTRYGDWEKNGRCTDF